MKKTIKKIFGVFLILLGIVGLFLPILQGILLIVAGLTILGDKRMIKLIEQIKEYFRKKVKK
ncbi:MAG: hypothetical protein H8E33_05540 [Candidatus Cloacimonetes bacterium]|nr:hypothetical protein [Candidatus Cloacimonadota bacterium]